MVVYFLSNCDILIGKILKLNKHKNICIYHKIFYFSSEVVMLCSNS